MLPGLWFYNHANLAICNWRDVILHVLIFLYEVAVATRHLAVANHCDHSLSQDVEQLFQEMQDEGIASNAMILTELMGAYIRNDNIARAYEVYEQIRQGEDKPEYITYEILCRGLKKAGDFEKLKIVMEHCGEDFPDNPPPFSRMVLERGL